MYIIYVLLTFASPFLVDNLYLPTANLDLEKAEEIQNAICTIATKEIEATANATVTRQLKGVCTSNELNLKMDKLQTKILQEIDGIKYILELNGFKVPDVSIPINNPASVVYFDNSTIDVKTTVPITKSTNNGNVSPRIEEILMYNDTTIDSNEGDKYFYYWKIQNIRSLLEKRDMYKSSLDFIVLGHTLHLQFYPNYLDTNHFAILLKPNSSGFVKKHRLSILNQLDPGLDLTSGVLYGIRNEERMLRVSEKNLDIDGFVLDDTLIIKLEILLNS